MDENGTSYNPYIDLDEHQFWRTGVAEPGPLNLANICNPSFKISPEHRVVTAGSCFAQSLSRALIRHKYNWHETEPAPPMMSAETARRYNYGIFSCRTGNIYSSASLLQWLSWSLNPEAADQEIWRDENNRFFDPLRPTIEPDGFSTETEVWEARTRTLKALVRAMREADAFIFTMGLTEFWRNKSSAMVYQMCPGTQAGTFNASQHILENSFSIDILRDLEEVVGLLMSINPDLNIILTVSPVPLTATASKATHALVANTYTKSTLRAVAGEMAIKWPQVTYFPSYELIATHPSRAMFYDTNMRTISQMGVDFVMEHFFATFTSGYSPERLDTSEFIKSNSNTDELVCDEMILEFYNEH